MITLIHGPAELKRAEALARIRAGIAADPDLADLNTAVLDGRQIVPADLQFACGTVPFLAERRLVVIERLLSRPAGGKKGKTAAGQAGAAGSATEGEEAEADDASAGATGAAAGATAPSSARSQAKAWVAALDDVPDTTELVLVEEELVSSGAMWKRLQELVRSGAARIIVCANPRRGQELQEWIEGRARERGVQLEAQAVADLADFVGEDLRQLDQELCKLRDYVAGKRRVTQADVRRLVAATRAANVFDMVDSLASGQAARAGRLLQHALDVDGEQPLGLLALLARRYRQLIQAKALQSAGASQAEIASQLGLPDWQLRKILEMLGRQPLPRLQRAMELLLAADESIKTGKCTDREAMDILLAELAMDKM